jgi:hypothetical protein
LTDRTEALLLDAAAADCMQLIEMDVLLVDGRINPNGNGHKAERNVCRFKATSHRP